MDVVLKSSISITSPLSVPFFRLLKNQFSTQLVNASGKNKINFVTIETMETDNK